jgi:glycosyltransferase involved in cell wall biosynthesis
LRGGGVGGYQYSREFLERLWAPGRTRVSGSRVINCYQLYPGSLVADRSVEKSFYIDMTLRQVFDYYGLCPPIAAEAIECETHGYHSAVRIVTHSHWAAHSLIADYGLAPSRVRTVVPGANLDAADYACWDAAQSAATPRPADPLRLVFVGRDWKRKGLHRLCAALSIARRQGLRATLTVIGTMKPQYPTVPGVEWAGVIDKRTDAARFIRTVASNDIGCLLSRAEAGGMSLREFHALGLVTIAPDTGGAPEHAVEGASVAVSPSATDSEIADLLLRLQRDRDWFHQLRTRAWQTRHEVLWDRSVHQLWLAIQ